MKILLVTHEDPNNIWGGLGYFVKELKNSLLVRNIDARILFLDLEHSHDTAYGIVDYHLTYTYSFNCLNREGRLLDMSHNLFYQIVPILMDFNPDIIHVNDRQTFMPFRFMSNVVFSMHLSYADLIGISQIDFDQLIEINIERTAAKFARKFIVYSDYYASRMLQNYPDAKIEKAVIGIDHDRYYSNKRNGEIVVSYFGRYSPIHKGVDLYIDAVKLLKRKFLKVKFNLYTNIEKIGDIKKYFNRIEFVDGEKKYAAYAESDVVVMPSRYEPFGIVGLEAIASDCILLAPKGLGMDEFLTDDNYVEIDHTVESICTAIEHIITMSKKPIEENKESVKNFSIKAMTDSHITIYKDIINSNAK